MTTIDRRYFDNSLQIKTKIYWTNGIIYRENKPAIINYYLNGKINSKIYHNYLGLIHRDDGPAIIYYTKSGKVKSEHYNKNGKLSRHDGPAVIYYDNKGVIQTDDSVFYLGGKRFNSLKELKVSILG